MQLGPNELPVRVETDDKRGFSNQYDAVGHNA